MKKKSMFLAALAAVLILTLSVGSALGYFYTSDETDGKNALAMGATTTITESYSSGVKTVTIKNNADSKVAVFVRAKAFGTPEPSYGGGWTKSGDYYYYPGVLEPGESTNPSLTVKVNFPGKPTAENIGQSVNVIVVYEAVPTMYKDDGTPQASDYGPAWEQSATNAGG